MRVLQLIHQYPPEHLGGSELYTHQLASGLIQRGHQAAVFTRRNDLGNGWKLETYKGVPVYAAWNGVMSPARRYFASLRNPPLIDSFEQVLEEFQPEIVHVQHLMGLPLSLIHRLSKRQIPYLVSLHDYWWICANANLITNYSGKECDGPLAQLNCTHCLIARAGGGKTWAAAPALWTIQQWRANRLGHILRSAAMILTPSEFVRNWYLAHGVVDDSITTLPLGVELPPPHLPIHLSEPSNPVRFLYLGGIAAVKGVHVIVEALGGVVGYAELLIAGDLSSDPNYARQVQELAGENVRFLGKLDRTQVWQELNKADALLVPSLSHETYCFVAREAQSVGTPLLASKMGALGELVEDGINGWLLPPGDILAWQGALQNCVDNRHLLQKLRNQARTPLTVETHLERIEVLYKDIS